MPLSPLESRVFGARYFCIQFHHSGDATGCIDVENPTSIPFASSNLFRLRWRRWFDVQSTSYCCWDIYAFGRRTLIELDVLLTINQCRICNAQHWKLRCDAIHKIKFKKSRLTYKLRFRETCFQPPNTTETCIACMNSAKIQIIEFGTSMCDKKTFPYCGFSSSFFSDSLLSFTRCA